MSLQCGIFGLPNVGKSTCLNALTQLIVAEASNYPFCTIKPNRASVPVPDARLKELAQIVNSEQMIPTSVEFVDIAGLVKNASKGEGLGNQFLSNIRAVDALVHVVRCFEDSEIIHVSGKVDPLADVEIIDTELILSDIGLVETLKKNYQRAEKAGDKQAKDALLLLSKVEKTLNDDTLLRKIHWEVDVVKQLKKWEFLTIKPVIYLANISEDGLTNNPFLEKIRKKAVEEGTQLVTSCIKVEADLIGASEEEKQDLMQLLESGTLGLGELIEKAYTLLGLHTFFTAGPKEVRAWTIPIGANAFEAAGRIHSDFQRGFIVAEVVGYKDFIEYKGVKGAKAAGKWRTERKDYVVNNGDVILFQFNV